MHYCIIKHPFMENEIASDLFRKIVILEKYSKNGKNTWNNDEKNGVIKDIIVELHRID